LHCGHGAFVGADNLVSVPATLPSTVTDTSLMFAGAQSFNQPLGSWNTGNVTSMDYMFLHAASFNQPLDAWCVPLIANEPYGFTEDDFTAPKPVWGTCPA
jgi:surface protein